MATSKQKSKVSRVMHEHKEGKLTSGSGKKVKSRKQAIAIAMSESGQSRKKGGASRSKSGGSRSKSGSSRGKSSTSRSRTKRAS